MRNAMIMAGAFMLAAGLAQAEPVLGTWQTQAVDNGNFGHVEIAPCGAAICGTIVKAYNSSGAERPSDNIGRQMIWDMKARGDGNYRGGKIWAPDRDKTYNSRMTLSGDQLEVNGCVLGICRGQVWRRVAQ
ncbi:MAG: DUF2147 domain-containing protein [Alphaproteobacteria bacterium]|nr:DUF2147 domain-containing protein [Alphaproteobacteria bacterium]